MAAISAARSEAASSTRFMACLPVACRHRHHSPAPGASWRDDRDQMTLPPWLVQSSAEAVGTQPWPLQAFRPLQELLADLQELWPLQALMPEHCTSADWAALSDVAQPATSNKAAAAATDAPEILRILLIVSSHVMGS